MTARLRMLPEGFEVLEPFVGMWAHATTAERAACRGNSSPEERAAFYAAARDLLPAALAHLDAIPLDAFGEADRNLMTLMLSLAHVALAIEVQNGEEETHRHSREKMRVTCSAADKV